MINDINKITETEKGEIRMEVRQAANKNRQIKVSADLHDTTPQIIAEIAGTELTQIIARKKAKQKPTVSNELKQTILQEYDNGESATVLSEKYGIHAHNIYDWRKAIKKRATSVLPQQKKMPDAETTTLSKQSKTLSTHERVQSFLLEYLDLVQGDIFPADMLGKDDIGYITGLLRGMELISIK